MRILVFGGTGFVGRELVKQLLQAGDQVVVVTRHIPRAILILGDRCEFHQWGSAQDAVPEAAMAGVDAVINLMGEGIADKRWSELQKKRIYNSRIDGTRRIVEAFQRAGANAPKALVSTSAVGIYGPQGDQELTENSAPAEGFLARLCRDWEAEARAVEKLGARLVIIRVGMVIGRGGALKKMLPVFKLGAGGKLGSGKQWMSWIHVTDLAGMYVRAAKETNMRGVFNGTSRYPATNAEFTKVLGKVLHRPAIAPAPAFAVKMMFGEMSTVMLDGQKVMPQRMQEELHFHYRYPTLEMALKETAF